MWRSSETYQNHHHTRTMHSDHPSSNPQIPQTPSQARVRRWDSYYNNNKNNAGNVLVSVNQPFPIIHTRQKKRKTPKKKTKKKKKQIATPEKTNLTSPLPSAVLPYLPTPSILPARSRAPLSSYQILLTPFFMWMNNGRDTHGGFNLRLSAMSSASQKKEEKEKRGKKHTPKPIILPQLHLTHLWVPALVTQPIVHESLSAPS